MQLDFFLCFFIFHSYWLTVTYFREWGKRRSEFNIVHLSIYENTSTFYYNFSELLLLIFFCPKVFFLLATYSTVEISFLFFFFLKISGSWRSVQQSAAWFPLILPLSTLFRVWSYMTLLSYAYWLEQSDCVPHDLQTFACAWVYMHVEVSLTPSCMGVRLGFLLNGLL